jgi:hypothetical protein
VSGDSSNESELGRSKHSATPAEHLLHLLTLGWPPTSPLILKYVGDNRLQRELTEWQAVSAAETRSK